jgi:hypothetical protein
MLKLKGEIGITEEGSAQPVQAAVFSAVTYIVGAALPLLVAWMVAGSGFAYRRLPTADTGSVHINGLLYRVVNVYRVVTARIVTAAAALVLAAAVVVAIPSFFDAEFEVVNTSSQQVSVIAAWRSSNKDLGTIHPCLRTDSV